VDAEYIWCVCMYVYARVRVDTCVCVFAHVCVFVCVRTVWCAHVVMGWL